MSSNRNGRRAQVGNHSGPIPDDFKQALLARVGLVDVVGRYVELKKLGRRHVGLCPFHGEKTPSFSVNEDKGYFYCFGCGMNGDAIGFIMSHQGRGYRAAVHQLAGMVGMEVPDSGPTDPERVRFEHENTAARRILESLEHEFVVAVIAVSDAARGVQMSEDDRARFRLCVNRIAVGIEAAKRRKLSNRERLAILGDEVLNHPVVEEMAA